MKISAVQLSFRMFIAVVLAAAGLYYRGISALASELAQVRAQEEKYGPLPNDAGLNTTVQALRDALIARSSDLSPDASGAVFLGQLTRIMHDLDIRAPMIRSGQAQASLGIVQSTIDVEYEGSLDTTVSLLRRLSDASRSWRLSRLIIERGAGRDAKDLSVAAKLVTFARTPAEPSP